MRGTRVLICVVGGRRCALPLPIVIETMRPLPIDPVPAAAAGVMGVAVIRGVPTPVLRLAEVLGVADRPVQRFVTIGVGSRVVALAVDQVIDVATIDGDRLAGLPPLLGDGRTSVIESIASADAELLYLLQGARLIHDVEAG